MKTKKLLIISSIVFVIIIAGIFDLMLKDNKESKEKKQVLIPVSEATGFAVSLENKYDNLKIHDFQCYINPNKEIYNIEIQANNSYLNRTFVENFEIMSKVIDKFFQEDFDKSYITVDFAFPNEQNEEEVVSIEYDDIPKQCNDEKYNMPGEERNKMLFGDNRENGGYVIQITESMHNIWFSKNGLGTIHPSVSDNVKKVYPYLTGKRQNEDIEINLNDGKISLSEMEEQVLSFLNENFITEVSKGISFSIAEARILNNGEKEGICFKFRRNFNGIPFEYGSSYATGKFVDTVGSDCGEVSYTERLKPDTILAFGTVNGTVVLKEKITEMISLDTAMDILSKEIGSNSVYEVYGAELVYRACEIPEEKKSTIDDILKPKWKVITKNTIDDMYTLFYIDVVTGEVTERFEYYYE